MAEESMVEKLSSLMAEMKDWERRPIVKVGSVIVELVKMPKRESKKGVRGERLSLHVRAEDSFRGVFLDDYTMYQDLVNALSYDKVREAAQALNEVNRRVIEYRI
ncbi:MAG: hypothetical protein DRJ33_01575 [Candidatus Methanomethylicota archaeon]|uniref:Uncharacterized protein n=1 Tax=Thermoproteota archaeon TaxID=2056631 RepID=A0A497F0V1_9CREN|nr:MAG: hypothetical protein DRJ33_01575 [Candidatus Verstraetearchaeota archaeon]